MIRSLRFIDALLADAEERANQNRAVQEWLKSLVKIAYDAVNVLKELKYESLRHRAMELKRTVCCSFSFSTYIAFCWRMGSKVRKIKLKLKLINQEVSELGLVSMSGVTAALPAAARDTRSRQTDSIVAPVSGRAIDESKIVEMFLNPSEKVVSVLPIIGMGGLGKTTFPKSICSNKEINKYFEKKVLVCVPKKFPTLELFKLILVQLMKERLKWMIGMPSLKKIWNQLGGKDISLFLMMCGNCD